MRFLSTSEGICHYSALATNTNASSTPPQELVCRICSAGGCTECCAVQDPRSRSPALASLRVPYVLLLPKHTSGSVRDVMPDRWMQPRSVGWVRNMIAESPSRDHPWTGGWHQGTPKWATLIRGESNLFLQLSYRYFSHSSSLIQYAKLKFPMWCSEGRERGLIVDN